ncbi:MAG: hypothetical protein ABFD05_00420 [Anaerolineaceae bacterium]
MELKPPLSFEGQIINLKSKNLIIEDESQAIKLPNYFNLPDLLKNSELFTIMYVMKYISKPEEWNDCVSLIDRRDKEHKFMDGNYGFPNNWREYLLPD